MSTIQQKGVADRSWCHKFISWARFIPNRLHRLALRRFALTPRPATAAPKTSSPNKHIAASLYRPLRQDKADNDNQEMRLLSIDTVPNSSQASGRLMSCTLRTCSVTAAQRRGYFALSYVWGDAEDTQPILVNGLQFSATRNLVDALIHVCAVEPECCAGVWVDAVCINQIDEKEKSSQVALMGKIYSGARETLAWLGAGDAASSIVMQLINRIWNDDDVMGRGGRPPQLERLAVPEVYDLLERLGSTDVFSSDVLCLRPYWTRIWTAQEAVLCKSCRLIAGTDSCFLHATLEVLVWAMSDDLDDFLLQGGMDEDDDKAPLNIQNMVRTIQYDAESGIPIPSLRAVSNMANRINFKSYSNMDRAMICMQSLASRRATKAQDMVFGVSGLLDIGVEVDYSMSTKDLYSRVAGKMVTGVTDGSNMLNWAGLASRNSTLGVPSWAPDWSIRPDIRPMRASSRRSMVPPSYRPVVLGEETTLQVRGVCLGIIESTSDLGICPGMAGAGFKEASKRVEEWCGRVLAAAEYLAGGLSAEEILGQIASQPPAMYQDKYEQPMVTTLLDILRNPDKRSDRVRDFTSLLHCCVVAGGISLKPPLGERGTEAPFVAVDPGDHTLSRLFDEDTAEAMDGKQLLREAAYRFEAPDFSNSLLGEAMATKGYALFRTTNGRSGYSMQGVQAGDAVYMVGGCADLLVLRPTGGHFTFLSSGCIAGYGGKYPIDWDNPPGNVEVIDIK